MNLLNLISFLRDKIYNFYYNNDIKYSDISDKSVKILQF